MSVTNPDDKESGMTEYERRMLALEERTITGNTIGFAYLLWFFLAPLMVHRMYLGRLGSAVFWCLVCITGIATVSIGGALLYSDVITGLSIAITTGVVTSNDNTAGAFGFLGTGVLLLLSWFVAWIVDLFLIPGMARDRVIGKPQMIIEQSKVKSRRLPDLDPDDSIKGHGG